MRHELLGLNDLAHFIGDLLKLLKEYIVGTVNDDLGQTGNSSTLHVLAFCLFDHAKGKLLEVSLKELKLLLIVFDATEHMPLQLSQSFADDWMQLNRCLILYLLGKAGKYFRNEGDQGVFEYFSGNTKLFELFLHLTQVHVIVDLCQLVEEHVHSLVVRDVRRHELL